MTNLQPGLRSIDIAEMETRLLDTGTEAAFFLLKPGKKSMSVDRPNHFYVEALYNFQTSQKAVSTGEFLWAIIKGLMVN